MGDYQEYQTDTHEQIEEHILLGMTDEEYDQYRRDQAIEKTVQKRLSKGFKVYNLNNA